MQMLTGAILILAAAVALNSGEDIGKFAFSIGVIIGLAYLIAGTFPARKDLKIDKN